MSKRKYYFWLFKRGGGGDGTLREMNYLLELISNDDYEKIKYRSLLLREFNFDFKNLVDYDEVLTPFGGINRNFIFQMKFYIKYLIQIKKAQQFQK